MPAAIRIKRGTIIFSNLKGARRKTCCGDHAQPDRGGCRNCEGIDESAKFNEVAGLIRAALRSGYAQPWMYEALALALQASDQPQEES